MRTRFLLQGIGRIRRLLSGRAVGASMLWAIGALVVLGAVGAGIALMSPSALQSKLEQEAGMRAYYNANAGLNFLKSMRETAESQKIPFANYIAMMGGENNTTFSLPNNDAFYYKLGSVSGTPSNGAYQITDLGGMVLDKSGKALYTYIIYGNGKILNENYYYDPDSGGNDPVGASKNIATGASLYISASKEKVSGDASTTGDVTIADNATMDGSINAGGNISIGSKSSLTGYLCSGGSINLVEDNVIGGPVRAKDDVTMESRTETGSITAGGDVYLSGTSQEINGDINAGGDITIASAAQIHGNITAGGSVIVKSAGAHIEGSIQAGKDVTINSGITIDDEIVAGGSVNLADSSISVANNISAQGNVNFTGWDGKYNKDVIAGSGISITGKTKIGGSVESGGKIYINAWNTCIVGVAKAVNDITSCSGGGCGSGDCYIGSSLQNQGSVQAPDSPDSPNAFVPCSITKLPDPPLNERTDNGALTVKRGKDVTFTEGIYYYSSINVSGGATIKLDVSKGDIVIFSTGAVSFGNPTNILISTDGSTYKPMSEVDKEYAAKVYLESNGNIFLDWAANWYGTLFARGTLTFDGGNTLVGSYASLVGTIGVSSGSGYSMTYVESNYAKTNW